MYYLIGLRWDWQTCTRLFGEDTEVAFIQQFTIGMAKGVVPARAGLGGTACHEGMVDFIHIKLGFDNAAQLDHPFQTVSVKVFAFQNDYHLGF